LAALTNHRHKRRNLEAAVNGQVRVINGANDSEFGGLLGKSILSLHKSLKTIFSIRDHVQTWVDGWPVPGDYLFQPEDDVLEFVPTGWGMKGAWGPGEEEATLRRIASQVEKMAEERLFRLRLNETEVKIFKVLQNKTMRGEALAREIGPYWDSSFKGYLAALVRHGLLDNRGHGYFVPPAVLRELKAMGVV
jgi:hypothetical protein